MDHGVEMERIFVPMNAPTTKSQKRKKSKKITMKKKEPERLAAAVLIYQKTDSERKKGKGKTRFVEKENEKSEILS